MRGAAAVTVCLYHYLSWSNVAKVESAGLLAVAIFFILSSLTMVIAYRPRFSMGLKEAEVNKFFRNRILRILPLLAFVASLRLLYAVLLGEDLMAETIRFFLTSSGLFAFHLPGYVSSFVGAWSLGIELMFYVIFPVAFLIFGTARFSKLLFALGILIVGQQAIIVLLVKERFSTLGEIEYWFGFATFLVYAPVFMSGFLIERLQFTKRAFYSVFGFAIFVCVMGFSFFYSGPIITNSLLFLVLSVGCAIATLLIYNGSCSARLEPLLKFAGDISYPLYLTHWIVWFGLNLFVSRFPMPIALKLAVALVIAVATAYFVFRFVDVPLRAKLSQFLKAKTLR